MARKQRHARHVLALSKGVSTLGTEYAAGTPIIHLSRGEVMDEIAMFGDVAATRQSYTLTDDDARKLLASPVEPYFSPEEVKRSNEQRAATLAKRRSFYKVTREINKRLAASGKKIFRRWWKNDGSLWLTMSSALSNFGLITNGLIIHEGKIYIGQDLHSPYVELMDPLCFDKLMELLK